MGTGTGKAGNCGARARRRPEPARVRREPSAPGRAWARECITTRTGTGTGRWTSHERRSDTAASWANSLLAQHIAPHGARRTVRRPRPHVSHGTGHTGVGPRHATRDVTPRRVVRVHSSCARLMHADPHANRQYFHNMRGGRGGSYRALKPYFYSLSFDSNIRMSMKLFTFCDRPGIYMSAHSAALLSTKTDPGSGEKFSCACGCAARRAGAA